LNSGIENFF